MCNGGLFYPAAQAAQSVAFGLQLSVLYVLEPPLCIADAGQHRHYMGGGNGNVSVESEYGKGSTFRIELPQKVVGTPFVISVPDKTIFIPLLA